MQGLRPEEGAGICPGQGERASRQGSVLVLRPKDERAWGLLWGLGENRGVVREEAGKGVSEGLWF